MPTSRGRPAVAVAVAVAVAAQEGCCLGQGSEAHRGTKPRGDDGRASF